MKTSEFSNSFFPFFWLQVNWEDRGEWMYRQKMLEEQEARSKDQVGGRKIRRPGEKAGGRRRIRGPGEGG